MNNAKFLLFTFVLILASCIGDDIIEDFVEPQVRISNMPQSIATDTTIVITPVFLNDVGQETNATFEFESSDENVFSIDQTGLLTPVAEGAATLTVSTSYKDRSYSGSTDINISSVTVVAETSKSGTIRTTSTYLLTGSMTIEETDDGLLIDIADDYEASRALPGLYVYLTNNINTTAGALEIGMVEVFEGAHTYTLPDVSLEDYSHILYFCKPFGVKVGDGAFE